MICARIYKSKNHKYKINGYTTKERIIYIYIISKCGNYGGNYQVTVFKCLAKQRA